MSRRGRCACSSLSPPSCLSLAPSCLSLVPISHRRPASLSPHSGMCMGMVAVWHGSGCLSGLSLWALLHASPLYVRTVASPLCVCTVAGLCAAMPASHLYSRHRSDCAEHHARFLTPSLMRVSYPLILKPPSPPAHTRTHCL